MNIVGGRTNWMTEASLSGSIECSSPGGMYVCVRGGYWPSMSGQAECGWLGCTESKSSPVDCRRQSQVCARTKED